MKLKILSCLIAAVCGCCLVYLVWQVWPALKDFMSQSSYDTQVLTSFQTVTVQVVFPSSTLKTAFGYDEASLSSIAAKKICDLLKREFHSRVDCSPFGLPYSFKTNPLNLAIILEVKKIQGTSADFNIHAAFERSAYFSLLNAPDNPTLKRKFEEFKQSGEGDYFFKPAMKTYFKPSRRNFDESEYIQDKNNLERRIVLLAELIIDIMRPDEDLAAKHEKELLSILSQVTGSPP